MAGDVSDFEEFYQACYGRMVALVAAMVGDRHQAPGCDRSSTCRCQMSGFCGGGPGGA